MVNRVGRISGALHILEGFRQAEAPRNPPYGTPRIRWITAHVKICANQFKLVLCAPNPPSLLGKAIQPVLLLQTPASSLRSQKFHH
jgi:hypothetical protein